MTHGNASRLQGIASLIDFVHAVITIFFRYFIEIDITSSCNLYYVSRMLGNEEFENEIEQLANNYFPRNVKKTNKLMNGLHFDEDRPTSMFAKYRWKRSSSR